MNIKLANKIISNFLKEHPEYKPKDILNVHFTSYDCFVWNNTPEGALFWDNVFNSEFKGSNLFFRKYMLNFFKLRRGPFINLRLYLYD